MAGSGYINPTADARAKEAAYKATSKLNWKNDIRRKWAQKRTAKAIGEVGHALGLAEQIQALKATGLEGRRLKPVFKRALDGWVTARQSPAEDTGTLLDRLGDAAGASLDITLETLQTPEGQAAVNTALASAGLPPIPVGEIAGSVQDVLHTWQATAETPIPSEDDPELLEESTSEPTAATEGTPKKGGALGWLVGAGALLGLLRGR